MNMWRKATRWFYSYLLSVSKENELALQQAKMRMVRWMCDVKVKDRVPCKESRQRLEIDDIISVLQQNRLCCVAMGM